MVKRLIEKQVKLASHIDAMQDLPAQAKDDLDRFHCAIQNFGPAKTSTEQSASRVRRPLSNHEAV